MQQFIKILGTGKGSIEGLGWNTGNGGKLIVDHIQTNSLFSN